MATQEKVPTRKYKVMHPLFAWRTANGVRSFERHEIGHVAELTDAEAKAHPAGQLARVEGEEYPADILPEVED